jgi:hypothetical protein
MILGLGVVEVARKATEVLMKEVSVVMRYGSSNGNEEVV